LLLHVQARLVPHGGRGGEVELLAGRGQQDIAMRLLLTPGPAQGLTRPGEREDEPQRCLPAGGLSGPPAHGPHRARGPVDADEHCSWLHAVGHPVRPVTVARGGHDVRPDVAGVPFVTATGDGRPTGALAAAVSRARKAPSSPIVLISGAGNTTVVFLSTPISTRLCKLRS